jgi:M6 family metalloprotease-like protein
MPHPAESYGVSHCCPSQAIYDLMSDVVHALDPTVDFSQVDSIYAVGPESSGQYLDILLYRRWPGQGIVADGKELRWGVVGNGNFRSVDAAGLLAEFMEHESGHLMGLSDLYQRTCATCADTHELVGTWSIMDTAPPNHDLLGWDKWLLGWIVPQQIVGVTSGSVETTLAPTETPGGNKLVVVPISASLLYAVEVRQPRGVDADLCDKGVLVYTVRADVFNAQGAVHVMQAQPSDSARNPTCGPLWNAAFDTGQGEVSTFEDATVKVAVLSRTDLNYVVRVSRK